MSRRTATAAPGRKPPRRWRARKGARFGHAEAAVFGRHLTRLAKKYGIAFDQITTEQVLADATNERSPLHGQFEWNDTIAARQYRLKQARDLMNHIGIEVVYTDGSKEVVHAFKNVEVIYLSNEEEGDEEQQRIYVPINVLDDEEDLRQQVIADLRRRIIYWKNEARIFGSEFKSIIDAIREYERGAKPTKKKPKKGKGGEGKKKKGK